MPFLAEHRVDAQGKHSVAVQQVPSVAHLTVKRQTNGEVLFAVSGASHGQYMTVDAGVAELFLQVLDKACVAGFQ